MASQTVQTIAQQVNSFRGQHPSTTLIAVDETTLRVHTKVGRKVRNLDISYDSAADLYNIAEHIFSAPKFDIETVEHFGIFGDQLGTFIPHLNIH